MTYLTYSKSTKMQTQKIQTPLKIQKIQITKKIILLIFENQIELTSTFLRFQEHYESPKFHNKIFSLKQYKTWYKKEKRKKTFTYYTDWNGFNIPSYILKPFYTNKFKSITPTEKQILNLFKKETKKPDHQFYIIAIHKKTRFKKSILKHEIAHALYYTNQNYKKEIQKQLNKYKLTKLQNKLMKMGGYHKKVIEDETHAYSLDYSLGFKLKIPIFLHFKLKKIYTKYLKLENIKISKII